MSEPKEAEAYLVQSFLAFLRKNGINWTGHDSAPIDGALDCIRETREVFSKPNWLPWKLL